MLWCSAHQPTQEQINELEERKINSSKRALSKMMERYNCPNNRQEIKELISDFRDVLESFDACTIVQLGEAHCSYSWQDHSSKGDE
jgi:proline dehydrogenase